MNEVRVAVVGYGMWGRLCHSYLIRMAPGLALHGVVSGDADKRKKIETDQGCLAYDTFEAALGDPAVDLIVLATPNSTHADMAVRALHAGKHVVTDKVMCLNLEECDRMIAASVETGKLLTVFQNRRLDGDYLTLRKAIADGDLGDVRWIEMAWQGFGTWGGWRGRADAGGGRLYDLGAHLVDQMLQFFPQPVENVYCRMHHDFDNTDVESEALVVISFEGGCTGVCDLSSLTAVSKPRFLAHGSKATFVKYGLDPQEDAMKAGDIDSARDNPDNYAHLKAPNQDLVVPTLPGRWRSYYENIADVMIRGAEPLVKLSEARRVIEVIDAARRSAAAGR